MHPGSQDSTHRLRQSMVVAAQSSTSAQSGRDARLRCFGTRFSIREKLGHSAMCRILSPGWLRCSSVTYQRYAPSSRLAVRAPRLRSSTDLAIRGPLVTALRTTDHERREPPQNQREQARRRASPRFAILEGGVLHTLGDWRPYAPVGDAEKRRAGPQPKNLTKTGLCPEMRARFRPCVAPIWEVWLGRVCRSLPRS